MYIWLTHRLTGVLLIVLMAAKILSGFQLYGDARPEAALSLHRSLGIDLCLIVAFCLHSSFGLRNIVYELGWRYERALTAATVVLAVCGTVAGIVYYVGSIQS